MCLAVTQVAKSPRWFESISIHHLLLRVPPVGGIGRRTTFRAWGPQGHAGSTPALGTIFCFQPRFLRCTQCAAYAHSAPLAQWTEHLAPTQEAAGSIPAGCTMYSPRLASSRDRAPRYERGGCRFNSCARLHDFPRLVESVDTPRLGRGGRKAVQVRGLPRGPCFSRQVAQR